MNNIFVAIRATNTEKVELASYNIKDVAHSWCKMWQDSRDLGGVLVTRVFFKTAFLERIFPREMKEAEVEDLINLK